MTQRAMASFWMAATLLGAGLGAAAPPPAAQPPAAEARDGSVAPAKSAAPFVVEYYYRFRWGFEEEFLDLYRRNHLPFLRRMLEKGSLLELRIEKPREHMPESERWDLRTTLVYRDAAAALALGEIDESDYVDLVGDEAAEAQFKREEQRRFELLLAHWDVNLELRATYAPDDLPEPAKAGGR